MSDDFGFIPIANWDEGQSFVVPIEQFDYASMDSPEDYVREAMQQGKPLSPIILGMVECAIAGRQVETVRKLMVLISDARKPRQRIDEIAFACGMSLADGVTLVSLAKKWGTSKQAIQRNVEAVCDTLQIRKTRTMRGQEAKEHMRKANFRKGKTKQ
jgi:hypothetical protein